MIPHRSLPFLALWLVVMPTATTVFAQGRVIDGLQVLYDFSEGEGQTIRDRSNVGQPLDLKITDATGAEWSSGSLLVTSPVLISSAKPAKKIIDAVRKTNAITIEVWLSPANTTQSGPARIVSLSANSSQRNVTLGQERDVYDVRLRTTERDDNGLPSTSTPKKRVKSRLTHVVFTRNNRGTALIYIDGRRVTDNKLGGQFRNWNTDFRLTLCNEVTKDRPWLGELHLVAIYNRAISGDEVRLNFAAGSTSDGIPSLPVPIAAPTASTFETVIAPLFAKHCLECHDSAIKRGGLNLSRKEDAFAGGESGTVITPGKSDASMLWESVASGEMPKDRPPLSNEEKAALKKWLDSGAPWTIDVIDPATFLHGGHAGEVWVQRLTVPEYISTVNSAVGVDIAKEAREILPHDLRADGFSNTAYNLNVDLKHVEAYGRLAEIIVGQMDVPKFAARFSKNRKLSTDDSMRDHVAAIGKWLLRGPLSRDEVNAYSGIATTVASAGGDFDDAMAYLVEAMLQSPRFIYRVEDQLGDGFERPVSEYELASRMSYMLWGAPPDEDLMRAADEGELSDQQNVAAQVARMLKDQRAIERSRQFVSEWLNLGRLANLMPNSDRFPMWDEQLAADMREETLAYFQEIAWTQNRPLADLLNAQFTFATPKLAKFYGLKPVGLKPAGLKPSERKLAGPGLTKYDLTSVPERGGLLTQGSVLTIGGDQASMVSRGLFVLHDLLRGTVNAPPPCVNTTPPPTKAGLTMRGIAETRIADQNCGVCHARFEPLAFGLEKYDGIGAFHEKDIHGNALRDDGEVLFPGDAVPVQYENSAELMNLLAGSERVRASLTWKLTQFSLGRPLVATDARSVASIHNVAAENGGTYSALMTAIVTSDLVQNARTEEEK